MSVEQYNHYHFPLMLSLSHFPFRNICLIIKVFLFSWSEVLPFGKWSDDQLVHHSSILYTSWIPSWKVKRQLFAFLSVHTKTFSMVFLFSFTIFSPIYPLLLLYALLSHLNLLPPYLSPYHLIVPILITPKENLSHSSTRAPPSVPLSFCQWHIIADLANILQTFRFTFTTILLLQITFDIQIIGAEISHIPAHPLLAACNLFYTSLVSVRQPTHSPLLPLLPDI